MQQKITPFLWFNGTVDEAIAFYTSVFKNAEIKEVINGPDGKAFTAVFVLEGQEFMALNGGPQFKFTEATSFFVECEDQQEIDYYWDKLTADGGEESMCGWLKDKYGLSWQIIPKGLVKLLWDSTEPEKSQRAVAAMMQMHKLDIAKLQEAYNGKE
ncbi:3-demethylubiquinone-9 3-methyltransferase [Flavobacterium akiainvivens]|uniref:3-demethylubiquinone-9 3-methyltransferase n=1 Tax=Flavobacterium akiainvivens TaxID=1202724 RepID=A0A0M9VGL6_9FLAO|nr:VOC family protein [Flavobacterium akiainvivens]KOS04616.1 3-demethylubiquinone-9 3-methyltransferase [Flavobacterium akiainvivens]SFQ65788.1 Glyoxalase superfamily enzyme, possibly 3-demethylubiquinone-9 3-methyltransferase [Flavobacterium akiainvivens]